MKIFFTAAFFLYLTVSIAAAAEKSVMGWVEHILVMPGSVPMKAKLDTGAKTSSIRARIIKEFEKDNEKWIKFSLQGPDDKKVKLERKIERWVRIKRKKRGFIRRPVVKLAFCVDNKLIHEEVNLSRRSGFVYPVLIGRNMLDSHVIVDASKIYTHQPNCE